MRQRRHIQLRRSLLTLIVAVAAVVTATRAATAGFSIELIDIVPEGPSFRWNYQIIFETLPGRERLESGNGTIAPGVVGSQDFLTIYNTPSIFGDPPWVVTAGPGFIAQTQQFGPDPPQTIPLDSSAVNATFRYVGPPTSVSTDTVFGGFSILVTNDTVGMAVVQYGSQRTDNFGLSANRKISQLGHVPVPHRVPEPSTWLLLMLACLGVGVICIRNRFERTSDSRLA